MADDSDLQRTEEPSQRKLDRAREEGQVPRSRELATLAVLMAGGGALWYTASGISGRLSALVKGGLTIERDAAFEPARLLARFVVQIEEGALAIAPLLLTILVVAACAPLALSGWVVSWKGLTPDFARLSPARGLANLLSLNGVVELSKACVKAVVIAAVGALIVWHYRDAMLELVMQPIAVATSEASRIAGRAFLMLAGTLALIALFDVPWQVWQHHRGLRMTRDEVKREVREEMGDPQVKAAIRSAQREMARRRMMAAVPKADVIVTNPTHYAVALAYDMGGSGAPRVVAKGRGVLAQKIRELGREHHVPLLEAPPLARALYKHVELDAEIPVRLYDAVAEVLAYVWQLRRFNSGEGRVPEAPAALVVPPDLDPGEGNA